LQLRFKEGLPIREIAQRWHVEAAWLHHEYAAARKEFRDALQRVLAFHLPGASREQLDSSARELLQLLG
jgi:RNA polymerase sigma-70 factor (ECF subfamily)